VRSVIKVELPRSGIASAIRPKVVASGSGHTISTVPRPPWLLSPLPLSSMPAFDIVVVGAGGGQNETDLSACVLCW
jgi:hypothetical protein